MFEAMLQCEMDAQLGYAQMAIGTKLKITAANGYIHTYLNKL